MANEQFCEPCKKILGGQLDPSLTDKEGYFPHHTDATSLRNALNIPCLLCLRAFGTRPLTSVARGGTRSLLHPDHLRGSQLFILSLRGVNEDEHFATQIILVPRESTQYMLNSQDLS
jgi:hypothetical protein